MWTRDWCSLQGFLPQRHIFYCSKLAQNSHCVGCVLTSLQSQDVKFIKFTHATHTMGKCDNGHIPTCMLINRTSVLSHMSPTHPHPHPHPHPTTHERYRFNQQDSQRYWQKLHRCWWTLTSFIGLALHMKVCPEERGCYLLHFSHSLSFIDRIGIFKLVHHQQVYGKASAKTQPPPI